MVETGLSQGHHAATRTVSTAHRHRGQKGQIRRRGRNENWDIALV